MEELNDDCQLYIINYLDLTDQLALWRATHNLYERWNTNICRAWRHQVCYSLDSSVFEEFDNDPALLDAFLSSICETLQSVEFKFVKLDDLKLWCKFKFLNVCELKYTLDDDEEPCNHQTVLELCAEIFPVLNLLKPYGKIDSLNVQDFKQLRRLVLTECELSNLNGINSIEELIIDMFYTENLVDGDDLIRLSKLKTLSYEYRPEHDNLLDKAVQKRCNDIMELSFHDSIWAYHLTTLQSPKYLNRLTLIEDDGFLVEQLQTIVANLPQLKQLDLIDFQFFTTEIQLWQTVSACPSLKILNISGMQLYEDFFDLSRRYMEQVLRNRNFPLTLYCHNTGVNRHLVSTIDTFVQVLCSFRISIIFCRSRKTSDISI